MPKLYPEILLVRFSRAQKVAIRKEAKRAKCSEAQIVRNCLDFALDFDK